MIGRRATIRRRWALSAQDQAAGRAACQEYFAVRMRLVGLLREHRSLTATQAARLLGESSGTCSFHLRQLAKYGVVEALPARGTERPWRATAHGTTWSKDSGDRETEAAARFLEERLIDGYADQARAWLNRRGLEAAEWRTAAWIGDALLRVTADELIEIDKRLDRLFAPYARRVTDPTATTPAGARSVSIVSRHSHVRPSRCESTA